MSIVDAFQTDVYKVTRSGPGGYTSRGRYEPGTAETIEVGGSLQPTNARELKIPEEGARLKQYFRFYTEEPVFTIGTKTLRRADVVTINDETYKIWSVEPWTGTDMDYFMAILYREPEQ